MSTGIDKLGLGLERLAKAGDDADMLGAALTSLHGALEDRFRDLLATSPEVPAFDQARVVDVSRVQWSELIDLMRLHRGLTAEDATLIRTMNRERQSVAHGGRFRGKRVGLERYAFFVQSFFPEYQPAPPSLKQEPMPLPVEPARPRPARQRTQNPAESQPAPVISPPLAPQRLSAGRSTSKPSPKTVPAPPVRLNPGLTLTLLLLLIIACVAGMTLVQTENRANNPATPTVAPLAPPLPTVVGAQMRITIDVLNVRKNPDIQSDALTKLPAGATVIVLENGPARDEYQWVYVRYGDIEGWVDSTYLREP